MSKTRIFVSSTCYDLAAAREDIRNCLLGLGHEPLLSEYASFPVSPDLRTLENCRKNLREHTDIFVLIVGCRRGALDIGANKSIVNLEYDTAKEHGLDTFVFVHRTVKDLLPVWETNPDADFTARVDHPEVFKFVKGLQADQRWVFPFERTADITGTLQIQLSIFLRELLARKRDGKLRPLAEFASESQRVQQIAQEKPKYWEFLLTAELLRDRLSTLKLRLDTARNGGLFRPTKTIRGLEFPTWAQERIHDWLRIVEVIRPLVTEKLTASWGPLGVPGNAIQIKQVVDEVAGACEHIVELEATLSATSVPASLGRLLETMKGWGHHLLEELERLPVEIERPLREANPGGTYHIQLSFREPPGLPAFSEEVERLSSSPEVFLSD